MWKGRGRGREAKRGRKAAEAEVEREGDEIVCVCVEQIGALWVLKLSFFDCNYGTQTNMFACNYVP